MSEARPAIDHDAIAGELVELLGTGSDHAFDARALDDAWQNGVDADVGGTEFLGKALGEADHAPFGGGIGCPVGIAMPSGGRGHVDDGAASGFLKHRHRMMGA